MEISHTVRQYGIFFYNRGTGYPQDIELLFNHDFEFCSNSFTLENVSKLPFRSLSHDFAAVVDVEAGLGRLGFYATAVERVPGTVGGT